jgi:hypothetical protein
MAAPPALPDFWRAAEVAAWQQTAPGAASNLLGTSVAAAAGKLPPQLAGYYRWPGASLLGCLNRFTKVEELGQGETRVCGSCGCGTATKQLSLRRLPPLLVFHAKRFEHAGGPPGWTLPCPAVRGVVCCGQKSVFVCRKRVFCIVWVSGRASP